MEIASLFIAIITFFQVHELCAQSQQDVTLAVNFVTTTLKLTKNLEKILVDSKKASIDRNTSAYKQYMNSYPSTQFSNPQRNIDAVIDIKTSAYLVARNPGCNKNVEGCIERISKLKSEDLLFDESCVQEYSAICAFDTKYRNIDGSCNNRERPAEGKSMTAYKRVLPPLRYADGISQMVSEPQLSKRALPYARVVSAKLSQNDEAEENNATLITTQWAQFIANDIAQTPVSNMVWTNEPINCCGHNGENLAPRYLHPSCARIYVPENDPVYGPEHIRCLNYVRSLPAINPTCSLGSMQQINQVTHYLDASTIYGSTEEKSQSLREMEGGRLRANIKNGREYLPDSSKYASECGGTCYEAGDDRANEHPQLAALHTIWLREHNRVARALQSAHANWTDEELYQETRRRVIAEIQHITYHEWLPIHFGEQSSELLNSWRTYDSNLAATVNNEVATAALRYFYSLMQQNIKLLSESRQVEETIRLADYYYKPRAIESKNVLDGLLRGFTMQPSKKFDINLVSDLTSKLYANDGKLGLDILSFDIQRGRDHGLAGYTKYRKACEGDTITTFDDLISKNIMTQEIVNKLKEVYRNPSEIDLIVGGLAELPKAHKLISDTFMCLLSEQLYRTHYGDKYFYDNTNQPHPFTNEQLNELRKVTLARIICDNADDITSIQPHVFFKAAEGNQIVPCSEIPSLDIIQ